MLAHTFLAQIFFLDALLRAKAREKARLKAAIYPLLSLRNGLLCPTFDLQNIAP